MIEENRGEFEKAGILKWHDAGFKGQGIRVAVLDEGPFLKEIMKEDGHFHIPLDNQAEKASHGTSVAQIIHEVAPEADIYLMYAHEGMTYVSEHPEDFDIANLSMSWSPKYPDLHGIPLCKSSGNEGSKDAWDTEPDDQLIVVGAWYEGNDLPAEYTNGGEYLTCVGFTNIYRPNDNGTVGMFNGTSCATPFVAGQLALWMSKVGPKTAEECKEFIRNNCEDKKTPGHDKGSGFGLFVLPDPDTVEVEELTEIKLQIGSKYASVNGEAITLDVEPFARDGRTFVPIRFVAESLGCKVDYNYSTREITITK